MLTCLGSRGGKSPIKMAVPVDQAAGISGSHPAPTRVTGTPSRLPLRDAYEIGGTGAVPVGRWENAAPPPGVAATFPPVSVTAELTCRNAP